jgi:hypothetical protein
MKTGTVVLLGAAGIAAYYFAQLGVAGATVQFVFNGVQFQTLSQLQIQVIVQNVSNATVSFAAMTADIAVNGSSIGQASYFPTPPTIIQPTSQQIINLNVNLSLLNLPAAIANLVNNVPGSGAYNFTITGNANINSLVVPFTLNKTITI